MTHKVAWDASAVPVCGRRRLLVPTAKIRLFKTFIGIFLSCERKHPIKADCWLVAMSLLEDLWVLMKAKEQYLLEIVLIKLLQRN